MDFPERLKTLREKEGLSQRELAEKVFVSRAAVAKWEQGRGLPNSETLVDLADHFGLSPDQLLPRADSENFRDKLIRLLRRERNLLLIVFSCLLLAGGAAWGGLAYYEAHKDDPPDHIVDNAFYSQGYLGRFGLENLPACPCEEGYTPFLSGTIFHSVMEEDDFLDYAQLVFQTLIGTPGISYVSYLLQYVEGPFSLADVSSERPSTYYLFPATDFRDCFQRWQTEETSTLLFNFFTDVPSSYRPGQLLTPHCLQLDHFNAIIAPTVFEGREMNTQIQLSEGIASYLGTEKFNYQKIDLNNDNFADYFEDSIYQEVSKWNYEIVSKQYLAKLYLPISVTLSCSTSQGDYEITKSGFALSEWYRTFVARVDDRTITDVHVVSRSIGPGYGYRYTEK